MKIDAKTEQHFEPDRVFHDSTLYNRVVVEPRAFVEEARTALAADNVELVTATYSTSCDRPWDSRGFG